MRRTKHTALPGFGITMGFTIFYLSLIVIVPLSALYLRAAGMGIGDLWLAVSHPRVVAAYKLSFGASAIAAGLVPSAPWRS